MAVSIEDLLANALRDFNWLKEFNCSPFENRLQNHIHITSMLQLQHTYVARQHVITAKWSR